jgi:hypothetical protein
MFLRNILYYLIAVITTSLITIDVYSQFEIQNSGTNMDLHSVCFLNEYVGFVVGEDGVILKTENGGQDWRLIVTDIEFDLKAVCFINQDIGFIAGDENVFYKTIDGGIIWEKIELPVYSDFSDIQFVNDSIGYVTGHSQRGGIVLKTIDAGESWTYKIIKPECKYNYACDEFYFLSLSFIDENCGIIGGFSYNRATGKHPYVCKTIDGGKTFVDISPYDISDDNWFENIEINTVNYVTSHDAYLVKNAYDKSGFIFASDYSVRSFDLLDNNHTSSGRGLFYSSCFLDRYIGYFTAIINGRSMILKTIDMGETFMSLEPPVDKTLNDVCFANAANGYFVGKEGIIIHLSDYNNAIAEGEYDLDAIDPPFALVQPIRKYRKTEIFVYNIDVSGKDKIDVSFYDQNGKSVDILRSRVRIFNNELRLKVKTDELTLGTYYYTVKLENKPIVNGKMSVGSMAQVFY